MNTPEKITKKNQDIASRTSAAFSGGTRLNPFNPALRSQAAESLANR
jgi:hypothetical protein